MKINSCRLFKVNLVSLAFVISSVSFFIATTSTPSHARKRECSAIFTIEKQYITDSIFLDNVGGFLKNKKKQCLEIAKTYARDNLTVDKIKGVDEEKIKQLKQLICRQGAVEVVVDTKVDGKINSRDGFERSTLKVPCGVVPIN
jgi:hypothetical protein